MRYRGGGIGHTYMREVENRFEDMRLEQIGVEGAPQAMKPPQGPDESVGEPLVSVAEAMISIENALMTDSDGDDCAQGEDSEDEQVDADCPGENSHDDDDIEDDGVEDEIRQGTYGMGEY